VTLQQVLAAARDRLIAAGIAADEAAIDVDVYARTILGWDRTRLLTQQPDPAPPELEPTFAEWVERRTHHEPTAYILGVREFWGLDFRVSPAVLIPRPETEFIVESALSLMSGIAGPRIADIGTGSGNIAVSLAHERTDAHVVATDVSTDALAIAMENARRHGVDDRVQLSRRRIWAVSRTTSISSLRIRRTFAIGTSRPWVVRFAMSLRLHFSAGTPVCGISKACSTPPS
jgi:release factor glutamine methyltransferase